MTTLLQQAGMAALAIVVSLICNGLLPEPAIANETRTDSIVDQLPAQIPEILTGGKWNNGDIGGVYRAVVVVSAVENDQNLVKKTERTPSPTAVIGSVDAAPERKAEVFIQWIAENDKTPSKIVKTVSIKEFNEQQLRHAFLAMDTLKENEVTLLVTSYDEKKDKDVSLSVKATSPGNYEAAK